VGSSCSGLMEYCYLLRLGLSESCSQAVDEPVLRVHLLYLYIFVALPLLDVKD